MVHYFVSLLVLQSSWRGRESWLLCFKCLPDVLWLLVFCGSYSRCLGLVCSVWSWCFLIMLTYFLVDLAISLCSQFWPRGYKPFFIPTFTDYKISTSHKTIKTMLTNKDFSKSFMFFSVVCLLCLFARLFICPLWSPAGKGLTSWLSFMVSNCEFVTFPLVSWVRCGSWLYRFLIFAFLLLNSQVLYLTC